jgi:pimeloyl-ACP methyl ester carboxylesterase
MKTRLLGGDIEYAVSGSGPALVLLHAFPLSHRMWNGAAAELSKRNTFVRFDSRGFGGSDPAESLLTMERIADDAAALMDHLRIESAIVGGCSMGGYAALAFARRHPSRLRGLVLVDTRAGADNPEARKGRAELAAKVLAEGARAALDAFLPRLVGETTRKERADVMAWLNDTILGTSPRGIADALHGLGARADATPHLREISVPALVVCGAEDVITPIAESQLIASALRHATLRVIPRSGHLPSLETPDAFSAVVREFLDRVN